MDPSLEDPSSPRTTLTPTRPPRPTAAAGNSMRRRRLKNARPKKTDEEDLGVQTAGIKR
jgi:hypothetical protein